MTRTTLTRSLSRTLSRQTTRRTLRAIACTASVVAVLGAGLMSPGAAHAQDYSAMIQQQMNQMNRMIEGGNQQINGMVQQRMQDPQVQASYRQYYQQMMSRGQRPMDYPTYTYNYIYTNGFSSQGMAHARANESSIQRNDQAAIQGLRNAQANRGAAQQAQRDSYFNNQQEAGRQLYGTSTYQGGQYGGSQVLPHTWQRNSTHQYQGNTYHVDQSGQYWMQAPNGYWYQLNR